MPPLNPLLSAQVLSPSYLKMLIHKNEDVKILVGLLLSAIFLIWFYPEHLDLKLSNLYFDYEANVFTLKKQFFLNTVMHDGFKHCMRVTALGSLLIAILFTGKQQAGESILSFAKAFATNPYFFVFVGMFSANSAVGVLKHLSVHGCPNDLLMYGGELPLLKLFENLPDGVKAGNCFPGGHASGGFALVSFYFAFKTSTPRFAKAMLVISLALGFVMGWAQIMRGEHFLSHNLWSAWVVWVVVFMLYIVKKMVEGK